MADWYDRYLDAPAAGGKGTGNWYDKHLDDFTPPKPPAAPSSPTGEEIGPWRAGLLGSTADIMTTGAKIADVTGFPETSKSILEGAESRRKTVEQRYHPKVPSYEDIYKPDDLLGSAGRLGQYGYEKFAESAPQMAGLAAAGVAAGLSAPASVPAGVAGLVGAAAADLPFFTGSNLKAQMETGKTLPQASLGTAAAAAVPQSLLDVALGEVLPGVGRAIAGKMLVRAAKKAVEGAAIEGVSEGAQQAIEIGQADPEKLFKMDPATQKEILEAAIAGGLMGGAVGGVSGVAQGRTPPPAAPPGMLALPPPTPPPMVPPAGVTPENVYDMSIPYPRYGDGTEPPPAPPPRPQLALPPPDAVTPPPITPENVFTPGPYRAREQLGTPPNQPTPKPYDQPQPPNYTKIDLPLPYQDQASAEGGLAADQALSPSPGIPPNPNIPAPPRVPPAQTPALGEDVQKQWAVGGASPNEQVSQARQGLDSPELDGVVPTMAARRSGVRIEQDIRDQLVAAGRPANEAAASAKIVRAFYERLGTRLQGDPWTLYKSRNLSVQSGAGGPRGGKTFSQSEPADSVGIYSQLTRQLQNIEADPTSMKEGTGQQWMNLLQKRGVKPEELAWSDLGDILETRKNSKISATELINIHTPYSLDVYETKPVAGRAGYADQTLGGYGHNPASNYREVVLAESPEGHERSADDRYGSNHFPGLNNPIAHYRTTDRSSSTGDKVLMVEEIQSDLHQAARTRGYRGTAEELSAAHEKAWDLTRQYRSALNAGDGARVAALQPDVNAAEMDLERHQSGLPDFPFKQTWPNMVFKHALIDAIRAGKDYVAWTTGEQQADRYYQADPDERTKREHGMSAFYDKRVVEMANKFGKAYGSKVEPLDVGLPDTQELRNRRDNLRRELTGASRTRQAAIIEELRHLSEHTVHALKITPQMRELVGASGLSLFQDERRARIRLLSNQTIIQLLKDPDASSFLHETGHLFLEELVRWAPHSREIAADLAEVKAWLGVAAGKAIETEHHEKFARGFERYLQNGKAPSPGLASIFKAFANWLGQIYNSGREQLAEIPPNISVLFDRMLAADAREKEFGQRALQKVQRNATPQQLKSLAAASPTKAVRFIVGKDGAITAGDSASFTHDQLMYPDGQSPTDPRQIEGDWKNNVAARGFVHDIGDGRYVHDISDPDDPMQAIDHPITQRLERAGIQDPNTVQSQHSFANDSAPLGDEEKEFGQGPVHAVTEVAGKAQTLMNRLFDPLSDVKQKTEYLKKRNIASGYIGRGAKAGADAMALFRKLSAPQGEQVMRYFETAGASPDTVPFVVRSQTVALKRRIYDLGQELVRLGVLSPETFAAHADAYIPRLYLKHLIEHKGITGAGIKPNLSEIKPRQVKSLEALLGLGVVRHPGVATNVALMRMERDVGTLKFLNEVAGNEDWSLGRTKTKWLGQTVTPEWLVAEADALQGPRAKAMEDMGDRPRADAMRRQGAEMRQQAIDAKPRLQEVIAEYAPGEFEKHWKQLPDRPQYGLMRGAWVQRQIADDITGMADFVNEHSWAGKVLGDKNSSAVRAVQFWKMLKVPFSPASQARNFVSNMFAVNVFGKIPMHQVPSYVVRAAREMRNNGPIWQAAVEHGIPHGAMAENELHTLADSVMRGLERDNNGPMGVIKAWSAFVRVGSKVTDLYGKSEALFKTAVMAHAMDNGMSAADAAILANDAIFDYSLVHPGVKYLRNAPLGIPFLTYTYKMLPQLAKTISTRDGALRLAPYVALTFALPAMVAGMFDLEDGDIQKLRMALAEGLRRQNNMYVMPYKDEAGRWQFVDIGYFFPWQIPQDVVENSLKGDLKGTLKPIGDMAFSNPIISAIAAMKTGIDPFTDRPIADKRDPLQQQVTDIMAYVAGLMLPSVLTNYGAAGKALERVQGTGINRYGEPTPDWTQIGARMFGINIYPVIPEAQRARNLTHMQSEIQQVRSRMTYELKDQSLTADQKARLVENYRDKLIDLTKAMQKYATESAMTPSLQRATARP